jgi:hypothetical protein
VFNVSTVVVQVLRTRSAVRCLAWNPRHGTLGLGQSPTMHFYRLSAQRVVMQRRARQRELSITASSVVPPAALWLQADRVKPSSAQVLDKLAAQGTVGLAENEASALQVRPELAR